MPRPAALPPGNKPGTDFIRGYVDPMVGLDGCGKSRLHRDSIPGPSNPQRVVIPTKLSGPTCNQLGNVIVGIFCVYAVFEFYTFNVLLCCFKKICVNLYIIWSENISVFTHLLSDY
jgi:hypothetical protein